MRSERDALLDAIDLAAAMTRKAALAGLPCGGGKLVIMDGPRAVRGRAWALVARALGALRGRFFAGRDYGVSARDLARLRTLTRFAAEDPIRVPAPLWPDPAWVGPAGSIDMGDATARGTIAAVRGALAFERGATRLRVSAPAVQEAGNTTARTDGLGRAA